MMDFSRKELKESAKASLKGKWGGPIGAVAIYFGYFIVISLPGGVDDSLRVVANIASLFLAGAFQFGQSFYFLAFVKNAGQAEVGLVFSGFKVYIKTLGMYLWMMLWIFLWFLLFIIPGIVKAIAYSMSFFIIAENPGVEVTNALKISMKMTAGHKWDIFVFYLSFLGWGLLCILTLGIGFLWLAPYVMTSMTGLYLKLKDLSMQKGVCTVADFSGSAPAPQAVQP
jgi:uncharacterized membrane protein